MSSAVLAMSFPIMNPPSPDYTNGRAGGQLR